MIHFRSTSFFVLSILFGAAVSMPVGGDVQVGDILHVAPSDTIGGHWNSRGANVPHPHILLDKEPNGNLVLAPVTHSPDLRDGPKMDEKAANFHPKLEGNILLHHVTADPKDVAQQPAWKDRYVLGKDVKDIKNAKIDAAKDVHKYAENSHLDAAQAHRDAAKAHQSAAKKYTGFSNTEDLQKDHLKQAAIHTAKAKEHEDKAAEHHQDAKSDNPVTHAEYTKVRQSASDAHDSRTAAGESKDHAKATRAHIKAAEAHLDAGRKAPSQAAYHQGEAAEHLQAAPKHAPSSQKKPDVDASKKYAKASLKEANNVKAEKRTKRT